MSVQYSFIIPAYNAEKTIYRCINSILQSPRSDFEIIVVDDGSNDFTGEICQKIVSVDNRFHYYRKNNGGVSSARNMGIALAKGKYICFVDSDDYIKKVFLEVLDLSISTDTDLLIFGRSTYNGKEYKAEYLQPKTVSISDNLYRFCAEEIKNQRMNLVCDKVFRRDIIMQNKIRFPETLSIGEDKVFVVHYLTYVHTVSRISDVLYIACIENRESLSRKVRDNLYECVTTEHQLMREIVKTSCLPLRDSRILLEAIDYSYVRSAYSVMLVTERTYNDPIIARLEKKKICSKYKDFISNSDCKSSIIGLPIKYEFVGLVSIYRKIRMRSDRTD